MMMPIARMSTTTVTKMKTTAAFRMCTTRPDRALYHHGQKPLRVLSRAPCRDEQEIRPHGAAEKHS
jgi:hypothetical protein